MLIKTTFAPTTPIEEVKKYLRANWEKGVECPCCGQDVKVYRRHIHFSMAWCLVKLYQLTERSDREYFHVNELGADGTRGGDFAKLEYWGLIEPMANVKGQKGRTSGVWRITERGRLFVKKETTVCDTIRIYDGKLIGLDGDQITIVDALGTKFDYTELMKGF